VHHVALVGMVERLADLRDDVHGALRGHQALAQRAVGVGAVDELHGNPQLAVGFTAVVHGDDVGVIQR
jgi:hypothetical protein